MSEENGVKVIIYDVIDETGGEASGEYIAGHIAGGRGTLEKLGRLGERLRTDPMRGGHSKLCADTM